MVGNEGAGFPKKAPPAKAKSFNCQNCGAGITLRNADCITVVCASCHSIIDAQDENYAILKKFSLITGTRSPRIELGTRGEIHGHKWEIIGFLVRRDVSSSYEWDEYLLFNPYQGYRWLTEASGHWSFVRTIKDLPDTRLDRQPYYKKNSYKLFNSGRVNVVYVLGEFYWNLSTHDEVVMNDYIAPPYMLSSELDKNEINWSIGEYIEPKVVEEAFKVEGRLPMRLGIGANQISPATVLFHKMVPWWFGFLILLTLTQMYQLSQASGKRVLDQAMTFVPNTKSQKSFTTSVFDVKKNNSNMELSFSTPLSNSWFYLSGELVNNDNGTSYPLERSLEHYMGVEGGESWSEGSDSQTFLMPGLPAGKYYMDLDYESGSFGDSSPHTLMISARSDVPIWANYFWCIFFVSVLPFAYWAFSHSDEVKRWSNSDYSPYSTE